MNCSSCGGRLSPADRFCPSCGARVDPSRSVACPACGFSCGTAMSACPQCHAPLELDNGLPSIPRDASLLERALFLLRRSMVRFADFRGRSSRSEFFLFLAFYQFASLLLAVLWWPLASLFGAAMLLPSLAVSVRRMRDAGYFPWTPFILAGISAVLLAGGMAAALFFGFSPSGARAAFAIGGTFAVLFIAVCGLHLFLVLQPTAEPGEEKRLLSLRPHGPGPAGAFSGQPRQPGPQDWQSGQQPFPQDVRHFPQGQQPFPQEAFPGQPAPFVQQPVPGQPAFPGQPAGFPQGAAQDAFPRQPMPAPAAGAPQQNGSPDALDGQRVPETPAHSEAPFPQGRQNQHDQPERGEQSGQPVREEQPEQAQWLVCAGQAEGASVPPLPEEQGGRNKA